jgi:uncharacterized protein DUF3175
MRCQIEERHGSGEDKDKIAVLVERSHQALECARPRTGRVQARRPAPDRALSKTLRRGEQPAQVLALPLGNVDAGVLINRAGKDLPKRQKRVLEDAKDELRKAFGRA